MQFSFSNKVALVTGGSSGIGHETALAFTRSGATVVLADINETEGEKTVQLLQKAAAEAGLAGEAMFVKTDVTQADEVAALVAQTVDVYGQLDFALNNAGIDGAAAKTADYPDDIWHQVMNINVNGVWYGMKYEIPQMLAQGGGAIVNLASVAGLVGFVRHAAYSASKHAVVGLTKTAALEYVRQGIRINAVCPGFTDTPMVQNIIAQNPQQEERLVAGVPARRLGKPEEIAAAVLYLCSEEAGFITGHTLTLDGGILAM